MPNIETPREEHERICEQPGSALHDVGDVRVCEHGKVQRAYAINGWVAPGWWTLSRFWNPIQYRRAVKAIGAEMRAWIEDV